MIQFQEILKIFENKKLLVNSVIINKSNPELYSPSLNGVQKAFSSFQTDSRKVEENDIFVCINGFETDGHKFAENAIQNGAKLLVVERELELTADQIIVKSSRKAAAIIAKTFFKNPTSKFKLIGITGTNGKTTTANIIHKIFRTNNISSGMIGTLGYFINDKKYDLERTTPDIKDLNSIFSKMAKAEIEVAVMEVSSHALALERVYGLEFDVVCFTNLSQDHLNFHKNLDNYFKTKLKLFTDFNYKQAIVNIDDKYGKIISENFDNVISLGFNDSLFKIKDYQASACCSSFTIENSAQYQTKLIGKFNVYNCAMAVVSIQILYPSLKLSSLQSGLSKIMNIAGRLSKVENQNNLSVFVDYAHTPDALENVLSTLKSLPHKRLICVFGAGGNRDKTKRSKMFKVVNSLADLTIVTTDNPRNENPENIIRDIVINAKRKDNVFIQRDRKEAIELALMVAKKGDIVLVAGKGQEKYQEIDGEKIHFDDSEIIQEYEQKNYINQNQASFSIDLPSKIDSMNLAFWFSQKVTPKYFSSISTNSQTMKEGALFFAFVGENTDGHKYVNSVIQNEKNIAIVSNNYKKNQTIMVECTKKAYRFVAKKYRMLLGTQVLAITGSTGKTTVKEYCKSILSQNYKIISTYKNENNTIGVPKTIFRFRPDTDFAVVEIGTNHFGEVETSANCLTPNYAIINNIGESHLEFLENLEGVFKEKSDLFDRPLKLRLFGKDNFFYEYADKGKSVGFGKADYRITIIDKNESEIVYNLNQEEFFINNGVEHNVINSAFAVSFSKYLGLKKSTIQAGLSEVKLENRMDIVQKENKTVIFDCYNANPVSMRSAIKFWIEYKPKMKHIAILGDMLELGNSSIKYHKEIGEILKSIKNKIVIGVGNYSKYYTPDFCYQSIDNLLESDVYSNFENSIILVKGSHSIQLEKLRSKI